MLQPPSQPPAALSRHGPGGVTGKRRLRRSDWLKAAVDTLAAGKAAISIRALAAGLGVTEGSFHHHFSGREDLIASVSAELTGPGAASGVQGRTGPAAPPLDRLRMVSAGLLENARADRALRQLALDSQQAAEAVRNADTAVLAAATEAFTQLGFAPAEAAARARLFITLGRAWQQDRRVDATPGDIEHALAILTAHGAAAAPANDCAMPASRPS